MNSVPVARGLMLCDSVRPDPTTSKLTLENCFNRIVASSFPCSNRAFNVVAFLADGFGELTMRVEIAHLEGERTFYAREHRLRFPDRLTEMRYSFRVAGCVLPEAGTYEVELFADRESIVTTVFHLRARGKS